MVGGSGVLYLFDKAGLGSTQMYYKEILSVYAIDYTQSNIAKSLVSGLWYACPYVSKQSIPLNMGKLID